MDPIFHNRQIWPENIVFKWQLIEVFLNAFANSLAKLLPKTLYDGIINKDINK